jgi:hypothetical protein
MEDQNKLGTGLLPLKPDKRDFELIDVFGAIDLSELPEEFITGKPKVKNQGMTDFCTAYAITSASELQEKVELNPEYQFAKTKQIMGNPDGYGADLRSACKSAVKFGSLKESDFPKHITGDFRHWNIWPDWIDEKAKKYRKKSYFKINGYGSSFNAIKVALWLNKSDKRVVITGALWRSEWTKAKNGRITKECESSGFPHAFIIIGWIGEYLIAHLSNGEEVGDKGRFYFHKDIVNKEFGKYGRFMLIDIDPNQAKKVCWSWWRRFWEGIKNYIKLMFD